MEHLVWTIPVALLLGVAVGLSIARLASIATARGQRAIALANEPIPDGVAEVVESLDSVGIVLDNSDSVLRSSPAAAQMGIVAGRDLLVDDLIALVRTARANGEPISQHLVIKRGRFKDSQHMHLRARAAPLGSRFVLLLAEDHTEEERLRGVRRDFVANVSHELKTPVGSLGLLADAIEAAAEDSDRVRAFAQRMQVEAHRLGRMTKEIIELTRIQSGDPLDAPEIVDVERAVDAAVDRNRVAAEAKQIRLTTRIVDEAHVLGDESLLVMALNNLVSNAVLYSPEHTHVGVGVRIDDDLVEVAVTDKGIGIAPADQERVFERFFRVDPARSRVTGGTGLGLSIVKHIAQSHGGEVTLWSAPGRGSTFTLRLPIATAAIGKD